MYNLRKITFGFIPIFVLCSQTAQGSGVVLLTNASWGTVTAPSIGSTGYSLSATTGLVTVTTGSGYVLGGSGAGSYLASGLPFESVSYSVGIGAFTGTGVSATSAYINGTSSSGSGSLSVLGTLVLKVGGVISVAKAATAGDHTATITVTVNFL